MNYDNGTRSTVCNRVPPRWLRGWIVGNPKTFQSAPEERWRRWLGTQKTKPPSNGRDGGLYSEEATPTTFRNTTSSWPTIWVQFRDTRANQKKKTSSNQKLQPKTGTMMLSPIVIKYLTSTLSKVQHTKFRPVVARWFGSMVGSEKFFFSLSSRQKRVQHPPLFVWNLVVWWKKLRAE